MLNYSYCNGRGNIILCTHRQRSGLPSGGGGGGVGGGGAKSHAYDGAQLMVNIAIVSMHAMLHRLPLLTVPAA